MYPVDVGSKLAGEDEAVNALLQTGDVHDLHKVSLHCAQLLGVTHTLVLWMLTLLMQTHGSNMIGLFNAVVTLIVQSKHCLPVQASKESGHITGYNAALRWDETWGVYLKVEADVLALLVIRHRSGQRIQLVNGQRTVIHFHQSCLHWGSRAN